MTVRSLSLADTDELLTFYTGLSDEIRSLFEPFPDLDRGAIRDHLKSVDSHDSIAYGAVENERICGHAFLMRIGDRNPIFGIGVAGPYHGKGHGKRLANAVIDSADEQGVKNMALTVLKRNKKAITMYKSFEFRIVSDHTFRTKNDSYLMMRSS